jgi:uncharacterized coiled-coil protein SlyX
MEQMNADGIIRRLGLRIAQLEIDKATVDSTNEELRSKLAELENRVNELEEGRESNPLPTGK